MIEQEVIFTARSNNKYEEPARDPRRGAALVLVLLLIAIFTIIVAEFLYELRIQSTLLHNHEAKIKARYVARAGQNAADGLLRHVDPENRMFCNEMIQLCRYTCLTTSMLPSLGLTSEQEEEQEEEFRDFESMQGCGAWSLTIPYVLDETPIDLEISDEQARINLNAMIRTMQGSGPDAEPSLALDQTMFNVVYELFLYQALKNEIEIYPEDIRAMLLLLVDYMDFGMVDGSFDKDEVSYFEYEDDTIVSMKNGPLDTVDEIRYLPGMTDELFAAVSGFLTVHPVSADGQFSPKANFNAACVEVIYAYIRGTTYQGRDESTFTIEESFELAQQMVQTAFYGSADAIGGPTSSVPRYRRTIPPQIAGHLQRYSLKTNQMPRYYRVRSTALTDDGFETTITKVVRVNQRAIDVVYFKER